MTSFLPWLKKEFLEGARSYRFLILAAAAAFFAFLDPIMLKLLPAIMKAQTGMDASSLIPATRDYAFGTFLGDLFEILGFVVCISLGGIVAKERKDRIFIMPRVKGTGFPGIILAKALAYAVFLSVVLFAAVFVSYLYAGILFPGSAFEPSFPLGAGLLLAGYFAYLVAVVVCASAVFPSGIAASLASVAVAYGLPALGALFRIDGYLPSRLVLGASSLPEAGWSGFLLPALFASAAVVLLLSCASAAMGKKRA
jgi:ABC-2 type transport system permease protein